MDIKERLLEQFMNNPEKEFYVRELARLIKISPTTISKYLKELENKSIIKSESKLHHLLFRTSSSQKFKQVKQNYNLNLIRNSGLIDFLIEEYEPEAIILFGSFAKAENISSSDIDLLIISPKEKEIKLSKFESILKHKIQLFVHSKKEIERMKDKNKELLNNWINGIKLYGFVELFK